jgi:hypothetical protein
VRADLDDAFDAIRDAASEDAGGGDDEASKKELYEQAQAQALGITGRSKMAKDELARAVRRRR